MKVVALWKCLRSRMEEKREQNRDFSEALRAKARLCGHKHKRNKKQQLLLINEGEDNQILLGQIFEVPIIIREAI